MRQFIEDIVREAGERILPLFGKERAQYQKSESRSDVVTKADLLAEEILISRIEEKFPEHGIISEERGRIRAESEHVWIMDPIDGTINFATNVPLWGVMLAFTHNKKVQQSAIFMPVMNEFVYAQRGGGAFLNGERISCSTT